MAQGGIYDYFSNKDELIQEMFIHQIDLRFDILKENVSPDVKPIEKIEEILRFNGIEADHYSVAGIFNQIPLLIAGEKLLSKKVEKKFREYLDFVFGLEHKAQN
jgi:AcrR family transcriptional regulator